MFALSDIQTAFFSTQYADDGGDDQVLCMGKAQFISHTGADGEEKRRKGYWGQIDGYMPLDKIEDIPEWLRRTEQGTSIFSVCMRTHRTDWRYEMTAAILINFFVAIQRREMEFEIDSGFLKINRATILSLFQDPKVNAAVDQLNARAAFDAALTLHTCLVDENAGIHTLSVPELGKVTMRMLLRDGLGYTIGIVRNGMYITNNLANFNEPFIRFPLHKEFAVIIEPDGKVEGEWFKRLENPRHDDLSAERITDPKLREQGERAFVNLAKQIRKTIKELAKSEPTSSLELEELNDFFASEASRTEDDDGPEIDPRSIKPTPVKRTPPRTRPKVHHPGEEEDGPGPIPDPGPNPDPPNPNPDPGPGPVPHPRQVVEPVVLKNERNMRPEAGNRKARRLLFTSPVSGEITVSVEATGLSMPDQLVIVQASKGRLENGKLIIPCDEGERIAVDLSFDADYDGPIETSAFRQVQAKEASV